jgi:hypothetical protein
VNNKVLDSDKKAELNIKRHLIKFMLKIKSHSITENDISIILSEKNIIFTLFGGFG